MAKRLPLSGSEHVYDWAPWGKSLIMSENCYSYSLGLKNHFSQKSTPGDHAGLSPYGADLTDCKTLVKRVLADNPKKVYKARAESKCRHGFYKIMMFVAPQTQYQDGDFHFYKQHGIVDYKVKKGDSYTSIAKFFRIPVSRVRNAPMRSGHHMRFYHHVNPVLVPGHTIRFKANGFSHKRGWATGPLLYDASGKVITDPRKANRNYSLKYTRYCSSFCVKSKGIKLK